ncbi:hypothetical protein [Mycolicibacterium confluentis]|uniref:Uncharacterized protein n=1 Tax=Mycolicibacterium confluentis TaxID=28047 RepID=A0A7I7XSN7_9MYCO|nr:hypothetical protein [Mycolicibacterium confluentis]MCV7321433.1 hypothetical protein [Mycolicibacterium confluentis]BBZ32083.1 hypothetical protein MCNF_06880 [Mycolicibacterium confluentis]
MVNTDGVHQALDIGGADGELMRANHALRGGVFDLPHVVPDAQGLLAGTGCRTAHPAR